MPAADSIETALGSLQRYSSLWSRTAIFSAGLAIGIVAGAPAAMTAISSLWQKGPPRRQGDRKRLQPPSPTRSEPYPHDCIDGGAYLDTPLGRTRYFDCGPRNGKKVVLIHGISTPSNVWRHLVPTLAKNGFRILAFDLVGRGYSDGIEGSGLSEEELYTNQLCYLLTSLPDWDGSFSIVGFSMGGRIAAAFARYFFTRIDRICLIAPAGMMNEELLPSHLKMVSMGAMTYSRAKKLVCGPQVVGKMKPPVRSMVSWQLENHKGFADALTTSWLANILSMSPTAPFNQLISRFGNRMQAVWGDKDNICLPASAKLVPGLKVHTIKGGDHFMLLDDELRDVVGARVLDVLQGTSPI